MNTRMKVLAVAGAVALVPSMASAFHGILVNCSPTLGVAAEVLVKKGLNCSEKVNKLKLTIGHKTKFVDKSIHDNSFDGCDAVSGGAPWDVWALAKYGSKITSANAALITRAEMKLKGAAMGSCNLSGTANSAGAYMTGKVTFIDSTAPKPNKIKGGKASVIARVGADLPSQSAALNGVVSKGFGAGGVVRALAGLDTGAPENGNLLACNLGLACPPDFPEDYDGIEVIRLLTNSSSAFRIGFPVNADCTAVNDPWDCCTGAGAGSCDD